MEPVDSSVESANKGNVRTKENVCEILELATIKESDLNAVTQCLYPMQDHQVDNLILLEVDEHVLGGLSEGDTISFRGNKHDHAVLCTQTRTYEVREAEISNSWLLVPNLKLGKATGGEAAERAVEKRNVKKIFNSYYEVKETKPDLARLSTLLNSSSFNGLEYESTVDRKALYSWEKLQNELQASDHELQQALSDFLIADIDGYLRLVSFDVEARSLNLMLDYFGEQSWELDEVDKENTYECLNELIHEPVFDVIFKRYTEVSTKKKNNGDPLYKFDEERCCAMIAKILLAASPVTEYKEFMETWNIGTPEKMQPKEKYLCGSALVIYNTSKMQKEIVACPEADLPNNIHDRLNELFEIKAKWTVEEITPYITCFTKGAMNVNALLTKYARCSTNNGIKYYGAKHGK
ncbi:PREDICTED: sister chromatid cohesion protein DCC1 [Wasmannia auropunctata]|uniref:sister chromatid cohesion protein DCC1 n=1 Tax=Wasmannia auropunctata TaxID=64793 RepID=UPI0005EF0A4E|nr:PREDICTED: sister chromatid cohesion protein DCC1 [Wasmannia auropunctata]XP_011690984.1 PREDICTED: sister chromatid cohesion protein DCC1 [Wasmannia auropunctata]